MHRSWDCCDVQVSPHLGNETTDNWSIPTDNWNIPTPQSFPCCWRPQECSNIFSVPQFQCDTSSKPHCQHHLSAHRCFSLPNKGPTDPWSNKHTFGTSHRCCCGI